MIPRTSIKPASACANAPDVTPLPHQFNSDGFAFRLLKRDGDVALFEHGQGAIFQPNGRKGSHEYPN